MSSELSSEYGNLLIRRREFTWRHGIVIRESIWIRKTSATEEVHLLVIWFADSQNNWTAEEEYPITVITLNAACVECQKKLTFKAIESLLVKNPEEFK